MEQAVIRGETHKKIRGGKRKVNRGEIFKKEVQERSRGLKPRFRENE